MAKPLMAETAAPQRPRRPGCHTSGKLCASASSSATAYQADLHTALHPTSGTGSSRSSALARGCTSPGSTSNHTPVPAACPLPPPILPLLLLPLLLSLLPSVLLLSLSASAAAPPRSGCCCVAAAAVVSLAAELASAAWFGCWSSAAATSAAVSWIAGRAVAADSVCAHGRRHVLGSGGGGKGGGGAAHDGGWCWDAHR